MDTLHAVGKDFQTILVIVDVDVHPGILGDELIALIIRVDRLHPRSVQWTVFSFGQYSGLTSPSVSAILILVSLNTVML